MPNCKFCGGLMQEGQEFCPSCGSSQAGSDPQPEADRTYAVGRSNGAAARSMVLGLISMAVTAMYFNGSLVKSEDITLFLLVLAMMAGFIGFSTSKGEEKTPALIVGLAVSAVAAVAAFIALADLFFYL